MSGLQHFLFCRRQWALIHIENQWAENYRTIDGKLMHERAHNETLVEIRGNVMTTRGVAILSRRLGASGKCDVLEFHKSKDGVSISGREGRWLPFPVEYKHGKPKADNCDAAQLCGQAMCLEEMLCCKIEGGALYYGETHQRLPVEFTPELRKEVQDSFLEMHRLYSAGYTPKVKPSKACNACSMRELCMPTLIKQQSTKAYMEEYI